MQNIQTVRLELLRHGPQHNQLLSPLTDYLGLCGNHGAATIHIDYEHHALEQDLRSLHYMDTGSKAAEDNHELKSQVTAERQEALERIAGKITAILNANPGLAPQLNAVSRGNLIHLQLILSASELAVLPFELARVPDGCLGSSTNWLSLQSEVEVCLTRQVRGADTTGVNWNRKPQLLFGWAGVSRELAARHIRQMVAALKHWLPADLEEDEQILTEIGKHITILENVSLEKLHATCRKHNFTHVHLLAHGQEDEKKTGKSVGLLLHSSNGKKLEVVGSNQLATALTNKENSGCNAGLRPLVVVLASCNSGHIKDVAFRDNSLAHELHQAGIPLVIASQFPLSVRGAELMSKSLYEQMLWGEDPRCTLIKTRKILHTNIEPFRHDWAALVAYASFPRDFDEQLVAFRYRQAKSAIDNSLAAIDDKLDDLNKEELSAIKTPCFDANAHIENKKTIRLLENFASRVDNAQTHLPDDLSYKTEILGLKGTIAKRLAEVDFYCSKLACQFGGEGNVQRTNIPKHIAFLYEALRLYKEAANESIREADHKIRRKRALHWTLTQYISLKFILFGQLDEEAWSAAWYAAEVETKLGEVGSEVQLWACSSAAELYFLKYASLYSVTKTKDKEIKKVAQETTPRDIGDGQDNKKECREKAKKMACEIFKYDKNRLLAASTRRQFERYAYWWSERAPLCQEPDNKQCETLLDEATIFAKELIHILSDYPTSCSGN